MVTVLSINTAANEAGKPFQSLQVQGGIESVKAKSGRYYLTARTCWVPTTFSEDMCASLIGSVLPGKVDKVPCEPYDYKLQESDEVVRLDYRWEYQPDDEPMVNKQRSPISHHVVVG